MHHDRTGRAADSRPTSQAGVADTLIEDMTAEGASDAEVVAALVRRFQLAEQDAAQALYHHRGDPAGNDVRITQVGTRAPGARSFTMRGTYMGVPVTATWRDGELEAPEILREALDAAVRYGQRVTVAGVVAGEASLEDPLLAAATVAAVLDPGAEFKGDAPVHAPIPPGAEA